MGESESAGNIIRNILKRATAAKEATAALNIKNASYQIQSGDTLGKIAQRHGFDTDTLARYNNISNPNRIQAGQTLKFPSNATIPSKPTSSFQSQIPNLSEKSIGISDKNPAIGSRMQSSLQGAPTGVDHSFIRAREGYRNTGYIPRNKAGKILDSSGVTIGSGIDLGQWDERGLRQMDLSDRFIEQARPFLGVKGEAAQRVLDANPLHIPDERLREYSNRFINRYTSDVASRYNRSAQGGLKFEELPSQAQTVITSLLFQYGHEAPERKIPNAWRQVTTGDWQGLYNNLRDFGDKYPTRRNIEADYLKPILQGGSAAIQSFTPDQTVKSNSSLPANEDKTNTLTREEIPRTGPEAIVHALQHLDLDLMEKEAKDVIRSGKKTARPKAIYILNAIEGMKRNKIKPDDMLIRNVPVLPTEFRPFSVAGDTFIPGDANELYKDLINMRNSFQEGSDVLGYEGVADLVKPLYDSVKAVYGFGEPVNPKTRQRGVSGFLQKLSGSSPKYGYFQRRLISKTQDSVGRGVIIPDPDYGIDEIGIPEDMAWKTYMPYIQHRLVRRGLTPGEAFKAVTDRTGKARRELEAEMGERPVIYSRSPAWHKWSVLSANPRLVDGDSIRINTFITSGISGDFDGDFQIDKVVILRELGSSFNSLEKGENLDLTLRNNQAFLDGMFKNHAIPHFDSSKHVLEIRDLEDFPHGEFSNHVEGKNGPINFYHVDGIQVIAYDEVAAKPKWSPVKYYSKHYGREVEIVDLTVGRQIITDDDPRAVYGVDPSAGTLTPGRFTPTAAQIRKVVVPFVRSTEGLITKAEEISEVEITDDNACEFQILPLTRDIGYLFGAFCGDGWWDKKNNDYFNNRADCHGKRSIHLGDLKGFNAKKVEEILRGLPGVEATMYYHTNEAFKTETNGRYGDTVRHTFNFKHSEYLAEFFSQTMNGLRCEKSSGSANKHIPSFVLRAPKEFREGLLCGLMDTDGTVAVSNAEAKNKPQLMTAFSSTSLRLARDVRFLASTLGIHGHLSFSKTTTADNTSWIVTLSAPDCKRLNIFHDLACPWKRDNFLNTKVDTTGGSQGSKNSVVMPKHVAEMLLTEINGFKITPEMRAKDSEIKFKKKVNNLRLRIDQGKNNGTITKQMALKAMDFLREERERNILHVENTIREFEARSKSGEFDQEVINMFYKAIAFLAPYKGDKDAYKAGQRVRVCLNRPLREGKISAKVARNTISYLEATQPPKPIWEKQEIIDWLELAKNESISWTSIKGIQKTGIREDGYDLTVPGYETFMNAEGVILSNTVNFHVPSTPEAVQEAKTKLMPSNMVFSIRDHDKVMNPPKHEQILGLFSASNRPSRNRYNFNTEADALSAIQSGQVKLSDEISIGSELPGVNV